MSQPDSDPHPYAAANLAILKLLARHGGCMRIDPLARQAGLPCDELCETVNLLAERRWLRITWRRTPHATRPAGLRSVERVALTRLGRARLPEPWVWPPKRLSRRRRHPRRGRQPRAVYS